MSPGNPEFRALYDAHVGFVWRCLRRLGIREADLMDVTQRVFVTTFIKLPEFEGRSAITSWLFGICQRVASDYRRSAPIRREVVTDAALFEHTISEHNPSQESESRMLAARAEEILQKIPENQRLVFVLYELEEMSGLEIAEALQLSLGTVRSRLRLAREAFRRELKRLAAASGEKEAVG